MTDAKFTSSYRGIGELLRSDMVLKALAARAELMRAYAEEIAPESVVGSKLSPPGRYKKSFHVVLSKFGGRFKNRAEARLVNDDPVAHFVERGTSKMSGLHVLLRAAMEGLRR